ncbi:hypothetical protein U4959_09690 [Acinetobacter junii]|jgi:hypothetical protein|uniref:hypothetical protein n=1 Tax=Acinetobacter junii TaxID=40215 RepID=UPI000F689848|nr:hypothetical protein [Acinetobacter junii]MDH0668039.1 hypothetical protein [Acinetobacter junii]MDH1690657.1 hypothetical protein [Acinetobacter junii]RSE30533.1 hypothetical protein EGT64_15020 [Acinetobacter junii]TIE03859.1 hypothetical protein DIZ70_11155 [Acinetobacter junii]WRL34059.1 hypothetical protein U4959_09690 [Acinetobacter junii]
MWSQKKLNVSQSAFLFSIIAHVAILIVLLKPDAKNSSDIRSTMKVTFVSASVKTNNDTVRISSEPSSSTVNQLQTQNSKKLDASSTDSTNLANQVPDFFDLSRDTQMIEANNLYDPLLDAQNRAKKAIKDAKDVSNLYQANIKPMDSNFLEDYQLPISKSETESLGLYKVDVIDDPKDLELYSTLIELSMTSPSKDDELQINQLTQQITKLLHENDLSLIKTKPTTIEFMIDPVNLIVLIKLSADSIKTHHNLKTLLENMSFDAIFINSNLNERPYSFTVEV